MTEQLMPAQHKNSNLTILHQEPLADKNWFRTGGNALYYAEPHDALAFKDAIFFAQTKKLPLFILGSGANCLISDAGFAGLVIRPHLNQISIKEINDHMVEVTVGAGVSMEALIEYCLENNIIGLEEFSGIPGTVGGSVYINLHYFNFLLAQFLSRATIFDTIHNTIEIVNNAWFDFSYDYSKLHEKKQFLLDATFILKKTDDLMTAYAKGRSQEIIRHRKARYPYRNTCGSFFRNFYEDEIAIDNNGKKIIYAAYYLDKVGVKGSLQVGNAQVSHQHANMIVNLGTATSTDIITLARTMQEMVYQSFGIMLQPECQLIGFSEYPLYRSSPAKHYKSDVIL